ncbi:MAG: sulfotransferase family 2 domain-containing protein [Pseudomonadota bacterium]
MIDPAIPDTVARPVTPRRATAVPYAFIHINKCAGSSIEILLGISKSHETAAEMRARLGADDWAQRLSFAVVRNPFDRVTSIYYHRRRLGIEGLDDRSIDINRWIDLVWGQENPRFARGGHLLAPATDWLTDQGREIVGTVLRFENLDTDWARLAPRLGVPDDLPVYNANPHPPYREILSATSRATIERTFAADLTRFGYEF